MDLAARLAVPAVLFLCEADDSVVRSRLASRWDDLSDADEGVYRRFACDWEPLSDESERSTRRIDTGDDLAGTLGQACGHLRGLGLLD